MKTYSFYLLIIFSLLITSPHLFAQTEPDTLWTKTFDGGQDWDFGHSVQQTFDGGYIISGVKADSTTIYADIWLIKTDPLGDTLWTRTFPGYLGDGRNSMQQTLDKGFIIVGTYEGEVILIKTDTNGDTLWTRLYGDEEYDSGSSVYQTKDGGYIITGSTSSTDVDYSDVLLIKTDSF
jgi:hypothetical protein